MTAGYLICFVLGLLLCVLAAVSGAGHAHLHLGHGTFGHGALGRMLPGHAGSSPAATGHAGAKAGAPAVNGFTVAAFLCWFGGVGYLAARRGALPAALVALTALLAGLLGAVLIYGLIFRLLLPRERVLRAEDTRMEGVLARVSDAVRAPAGVGEILFSQTGARRSAPARSEDGRAIERDTEVIVLRYERGIATVRPFHEPIGEETEDSSTTNL